jgi:hypothetical protein
MFELKGEMQILRNMHHLREENQLNGIKNKDIRCVYSRITNISSTLDAFKTGTTSPQGDVMLD